WDTVKHQAYLKEMVAVFKKAGIRVSLFVDPVVKMVTAAAKTGADRVELHTEAYARAFMDNRVKAIAPYLEAAEQARALGLGLNAGHDLDLSNLKFFKDSIPYLDEVSIG